MKDRKMSKKYRNLFNVDRISKSDESMKKASLKCRWANSRKRNAVKAHKHRSYGLIGGFYRRF